MIREKDLKNILFEYESICVWCQKVVVSHTFIEEPACFDCLDKLPKHIPEQQGYKWLKEKCNE